jgi:hypothetical protein
MNGTSQPIPPPPGAPPQTPPKKGLGPLGWILIGCGGLVVIGMVAMGACFFVAKRQVDKFGKNPTLAAAEMMVRLNPDLEVVSKDDDKGTLTIRNKKTGEVGTFNAEDAKNGHISWKSDKGSVTFDGSGAKVTNEKGETTTFGSAAPQSFPAWIPTYPGGTVQGTMDTHNAEGHSAAFTVSTADTVDKVLEFYETQFKNAGLQVEKTTTTTNDQTAGGNLTAKSDDGKREATVIVSGSGGQTQAIVTFQDRK